ncbi:hypothetical protein ERO13_D12G059200v2 [Gossypium hirsutum]|uniref:Uncharacterized protein isoform X2 n=1 Tax=Gossypium hirsutum TaxID=3635 RepID=A0ABM3BBE8_GOSHI|nr:uncharacterized protein LOC107942685 isoform X2 [Gossypium hirsutum]KAG4114657.1 hypothetical protein ERO13_D12G059200v2 [Gossypium hirsutum]
MANRQIRVPTHSTKHVYLVIQNKRNNTTSLSRNRSELSILAKPRLELVPYCWWVCLFPKINFTAFSLFAFSQWMFSSFFSFGGYEGKDFGLAAVTTLASSLDYMSFRSSLKLLLPLADPAQVLNVPVIPIGTLLAAAHPFAANPPYLLSWLSPQISALDMLQPKLFETLVTENFIKKICFTFGFQDNAQMLNVDSGIDAFNCHIAHYDIVGAQRAVDLMYPCII